MVYNKIPRILCVDDDALILNAFEITFHEIFNIYTAKSADEAFQILEKSDIDIIIADHNMPKVTGVELLEKVSIKYPDVIRILATAQDDNLFIIKALNKTQLYAFFRKPLDLENVKEIIFKAFEFKKLRDENSELQNQLTASNEQFVELTNYLQKEITEKNNLYNELKKSQLQFNQALNIAKIGHWHLDIIKNKTTISDEVYRIFGFEPQEIEVTFETFANLIHPEDRNYVLNAISVSQKNNSPYDITHRILLRNGEIKYVKEIGITIQNSNGEPVESFGTMKDITVNKLQHESSKKTILIVDDDAATILLVEKICSINNYKTIFANSANAALKLLENNRPDLILLDFRLPDMNGFDLCKKIKTLSQEIFLVPVIFITAYSDYNSIVEGLKLGAVDFITKPFHIEELLAKIKNHLELFNYHKFYKEQTTEQLFENEKALKIKNFELENLIREVQSSKNALKESEEKFSKAFYSNPAIGVITTINDNRITEINLSFTKFLGYTAGEIIGKTTLEIGFFEDEIKRKEYIDKLQKNGFLHNERLRVRHKNGNILTLTWSVEIIEINNVLCTISTGIDITQQIKFQEELVNKNIELRDAKEQTLSALEEYMVINDALTASEERYREIVEGSDNLILEINSFGNILYVNKASQNILGINPKLCIGLSIFDFVPKEDFFRTTKKFKIWIKNKSKSKSFENRILSNSGVISHFQWTINFHYNEFGDLISVKGIGKDITEQKKSEIKLKHSESALKLAQKAAKIGHWELNIEKNTFYLSDEIYNILNIEKSEFSGNYETLFNKIHPEDYENVTQIYLNQMKDNNEFNILHRLLLKNEEIKYVNHRCIKVFDNKGNSVKLIGTIQDVTELENARIQLTESKLKYKTVADYTYDWEFWIKPDGKFEYISPSVERITGFSANDFYQNPDLFREIIHSDDSDRFIKLFDNALQDKLSHLATYKIITKKNRIKWIENRCQPVYNSKGEYIGQRASNRDITERKLHENEIKKLLTAVNQSANIIIITDVIGKIQYVNPKFTEITGYTSAEVIGEKSNILKSGKMLDNHYNNLWNTISSGKVWSGEFQNKKKDGQIFWTNSTISPVFNENSEIINYIGIQEDITYKKEIERFTKIVIIDAEEKERKRFAQDIHDGFGPVLSSLKHYFDWLLINKDESKKAIISEQINELFAEAIANIKDITYNLSPVFIETLGINEALDRFTKKIAFANNIDFKVFSNIKKRLDPKIELVLYRIFTELINNSLKYANAKNITMAIQKVNNKIKCVYSDNGVGFNTNAENTGTGFHNLTNRISAYNGDIKITSEINKGVKIYFYIAV